MLIMPPSAAPNKPTQQYGSHHTQPIRSQQPNSTGHTTTKAYGSHIDRTIRVTQQPNYSGHTTTIIMWWVTQQPNHNGSHNTQTKRVTQHPTNSGHNTFRSLYSKSKTFVPRLNPALVARQRDSDSSQRAPKNTIVY